MIEELCRLCAQPRKQTVDMFCNESIRHLVHYKIVQSLNIVVSEGDPLTKHVCVLCVGKLDFVWNFTNDCRKAQTILRKNRAELLTNEEFETSWQISKSLLTSECDHDGTTAGGLTISCEGQLLQCLRERPLTSGNTGDVRTSTELHEDLYSSVDNKDIQILEETGTNASCFTPIVAESDDTISLSLTLTCEDEKINLETYVGNKNNLPSPSNRDNTSLAKVIAPDVGTEKTNSNSTTAENKCPVVVISCETSQNVAVEKVTDTPLNSELRADESELGTRKVCDFQTENSPALATEMTKSSSIPSTSSENNANVAQFWVAGDRILDTAAGDSKKVNEIIRSVFEKDDDDEDEDSDNQGDVSYVQGSEDDDDETDGSSANEDDNSDGTDGSSAKVKDDTRKNKTWHFVPEATAKEEDTDLLNNRIPWLKVVKEEKKNSKIIYIVNLDVENLKDRQDFKIMPEVGLYLRHRESNFASNGFQAILPVLIENIIKGKCSMMPYYLQWSDMNGVKKLGMKCPFCKRILSLGRQALVNHLNNHLHLKCPECIVFYTTPFNIRNHLSSTLHPDASPEPVCAECSESFGGGDVYRYLRHVREHYDGYSCAMCDFSTSKKSEWLKHLKVERNNANCCSFDCSLFYEDVDSLFRHVSSIEKEGGYVCGACGLPFHSEEHLLWHLDIYGLQHGKKSLEEENMADMESEESIPHLRRQRDFPKVISIFNQILENKLPLENFECAYTRPGSGLRKGYQCVRCSHIAQSERSFITHIRIHLMYCCYKCRIFKKLGELKKHLIKRNCFTPRSCSLCDGNVMLTNLESYLEHASHHIKRVICIYCQKIMTDFRKVEGHIKTFHYEKHFKKSERTACEICGAIVRRTSLRTHIKGVHAKQTKGKKDYLCDTCGKSFKTLLFLRKHESKTHTLGNGSESAEQYICSYCDKRFYSKVYLQQHILPHLNERKFECDICHKKFNRSTYLEKHNKDVHSEKKWKCELCPCAYSYRSALVTHRLNSHS